MAIPLQSLPNRPSNSRDSMTSETSAILSYALGKHVDNDDLSSDSDNPSTHASEDETFFKENDPLNSEYEPYPQKKVPLPIQLMLEIAQVQNLSLYGIG